MTIDYFVMLAQQATADMSKSEPITIQYHLLTSQERKQDADALRSEWGKKHLRQRLDEPDFACWQFIKEPTIDLTPLPAYSFTLRFTFRLAQPYLSKDDNPFYIIDNPIVRDKVFRLPMVRPSGWKGSLRTAVRQTRNWNDRHPDLLRLFGQVNEAEDQGQAGRLLFYPTFFTQTGLEIINPHDRTRRVGKNPILFESVPSGTTGCFTLLYVPFDRVGKDKQETKAQVAEDLTLLAEGLRAMFTLYGFGAKTSSGFGAAEDAVRDGVLTLRATGLQAGPEPSQATPDPSLPRYLEAAGRLDSDLRATDGSLVPEEEYQRRIESRGQQYAKKDRQLYQKAKAWWEREGKALAAEGAESEPEPPAPPEPSPPRWPAWSCASFGEMVSQVGKAAQQLTQGGAA